MKRSTWAWIILLALVIGFIFSPFSLILVQGDSMEPTIPGGSVLLTYDSGQVESGDIITFKSERNNRYITHRVVRVTDKGEYITKGDNNPVSDQKVGEPPVTDSQVVGEAVTVFGNLLFIPSLASFFIIIRMNIVSVVLTLAVLGIVLYGFKQRRKEKQIFNHLTAADIFQPILAITLVVITATLILSANTVIVAVTYSTAPVVADRQYVVPVSENEQVTTVMIKQKPTPYTHSIYVADGFEITDINQVNKTHTELTVILPPKQDPGSLETTVTIYHFPKILPLDMYVTLSTITPLLPAVLISSLVVAPFYFWYRFFIGKHTPLYSILGETLYKRYFQ